MMKAGEICWNSHNFIRQTMHKAQLHYLVQVPNALVDTHQTKLLALKLYLKITIHKRISRSLIRHNRRNVASGVA